MDLMIKNNKTKNNMINKKNNINKESALRGQAKGQAAMEYLMTYGWAILIIVIVLAVLLFYLPQFLRAPESCIFAQPGFSCSDQKPSIYIPTGEVQTNLAINLFNGQGKPIIVSYLMCTTAGPSEVTTEVATSIDPITITAGATETFGAVSCTDKNNQALNLPAGNDFRGNFIIWYNFVEDVNPDVKRQAHAVISGPVQQ